jgi:hypothetical protein
LSTFSSLYNKALPFLVYGEKRIFVVPICCG